MKNFELIGIDRHGKEIKLLDSNKEDAKAVVNFLEEKIDINNNIEFEFESNIDEYEKQIILDSIEAFYKYYYKKEQKLNEK